MTAHRAVTIHCDGPDCLQWTGGRDSRADYERERAKADGWTRTKDGRDLCPQCAERGAAS